MCIALPRKIVAVADHDRALVAVGDGRAEDDGAGNDVVSAVLICAPGGVAALVGQWTLVHAGFALTLIDEADARSRLAMFAAIGGAETPLDLEDFYASRRPPAGAPTTHRPGGASGRHGGEK